MNRPKPSAVLLAIATLLLAGCGKKEDARQDADANDGAKSVEDGATHTPPSQSAMPQEPKSGASQTSPQQVRQRIMADIVETIGKPDGGLTRDHWRKIKERYWLPSFDHTVRGLDDAKSVSELLATPEGKTPLVVQLLSGSFETQDPAEEEALLAFHNMALVTAATGGASLSSALADRRNDPNITQGDVIMFEVFNDAFVDMPRRSQVSQETLQEWQELASSPNALVRLLALRTFSNVAPNPEQWLEFYRSYQAESDPLILEEATSLAFLTGLPSAADFLSEVRDRVGQETSSAFSEKLDRSIEFLRSRPLPE